MTSVGPASPIEDTKRSSENSDAEVKEVAYCGVMDSPDDAALSSLCSCSKSRTGCCQKQEDTEGDASEPPQTGQESPAPSASHSRNAEMQFYLDKLREMVPYAKVCPKMSKVQLIHCAIDYITDLQESLEARIKRKTSNSSPFSPSRPPLADLSTVTQQNTVDSSTSVGNESNGSNLDTLRIPSISRDDGPARVLPPPPADGDLTSALPPLSSNLQNKLTDKHFNSKFESILVTQKSVLQKTSSFSDTSKSPDGQSRTNLRERDAISDILEQSVHYAKSEGDESIAQCEDRKAASVNKGKSEISVDSHTRVKRKLSRRLVESPKRHARRRLHALSKTKDLSHSV